MTLRDKVRFECEPLCLGVEVDADSFIRRVNEAVEVSDELRDALRTFAYVYSATTNAKFTFADNEKPALLVFKTTWENRKNMTPAELWHWRMHSAHALMVLWQDDYIDAQQLVEVEAGQLPTDKLTQAQQKELANPDSPLASNATSSPAA